MLPYEGRLARGSILYHDLGTKIRGSAAKIRLLFIGLLYISLIMVSINDVHLKYSCLRVHIELMFIVGEAVSDLCVLVFSPLFYWHLHCELLCCTLLWVVG